MKSLIQTLTCPKCGHHIPHNCAIEIGRLNKGVTTPKKAEASRRNMEKARAKRWPPKQIVERRIEIHHGADLLKQIEAKEE